MTARTHDAFAFASLLTAAAYFPPTSLSVTTVFAAVVGNVVGALIPDMDQASNRLWDLLPAGDKLAKIFRRLFLKHRTLSHSFLGAFLLYKLLQWLLPRVLNANYINIEIVFASIMIGFFSHLLADGLTKEGLPLFFPFGFKIGFPPIKKLRITTDSWVEHWLVLPLVVSFIIWIVNTHREAFAQILKTVVS